MKAHCLQKKETFTDITNDRKIRKIIYIYVCVYMINVAINRYDEHLSNDKCCYSSMSRYSYKILDSLRNYVLFSIADTNFLMIYTIDFY